MKLLFFGEDLHFYSFKHEGTSPVWDHLKSKLNALDSLCDVGNSKLGYDFT